MGDIRIAIVNTVKRGDFRKLGRIVKMYPGIVDMISKSTDLMEFAVRSNATMVENMITYGAPISGYLLHIALNGDIIKVLISYGANPYALNEKGDLPLCSAVKSYRLSNVKELIKVYPDIKNIVNKKYSVGYLIYYAVLMREFEIAEELIIAGADISAENKYGNALIHNHMSQLSDYYVFSFLETLIDNGANINTKDRDGNTLLHISIKKKVYHFAIYTIEKGIDTLIRNNEGKLAEDYLPIIEDPIVKILKDLIEAQNYTKGVHQG